MRVQNVLHLTSWISRAGGGIPPVVWSQARELKRRGVPSSVAGLSDEFVQGDCEGWGVPYFTGGIVGPRAFGFSPSLRGKLVQNAVQGGVIHSHGLWMYPGRLARSLAQRTSSPLVVSPHGMLEPWALKNSGWKKRIAARLFEDGNLRAADCILALCDAEARQIRDYGLKNPIAIVPNGIAMEEYASLPGRNAIESSFPELNGRKRLLFLSRIHPKKGLPHLIRAWSRVSAQYPQWMLIIGGNDQGGHRHEMELLAEELGVAPSVKFLGPVFGEMKMKTLAGADAFVLPSLSEGFSVAVLEAAACGLPVLMTSACNFPELKAAHAAIEFAPNATDCEIGVRCLLAMTDAERREMGGHGRDLIAREYTWSRIVDRLGNVYEWLLGSSPAPDFVQCQ